MEKKYRNAILDCRGELLGLATLMIVFHHLSNRGIPGIASLPTFLGGPLKFIFAKGYIGVDIFIFLSAIGLCYSMERNTVSQFFKNRFRRVAVTWFVIMIPVFIVEDIILCKQGIKEVLFDTSTLRYWFDNDNTHTPWFVPFIMAIYIIFPLIYKIHIKTKCISTYILFAASILFNIVCSIYSNYIYSEFTVCFARLPILFLGILLAEHIKTNINLNKKFLFSAFFTIGVLYVLWYFTKASMGIDMMIGGVVAIGIILFYAYVIKPIVCCGISKALVFIGTVSLEVYLIHTVILRVLDNTNVPDILFMLQYVLLPLSSIILAKGISWVSDKVTEFANLCKCKFK